MNKKIIAFLVAAIMVLSCAVTAFADDAKEDMSISIGVVAGSKAVGDIVDIPVSITLSQKALDGSGIGALEFLVGYNDEFLKPHSATDDANDAVEITNNNLKGGDGRYIFKANTDAAKVGKTDDGLAGIFVGYVNVDGVKTAAADTAEVWFTAHFEVIKAIDEKVGSVISVPHILASGAEYGSEVAGEKYTTGTVTGGIGDVDPASSEYDESSDEEPSNVSTESTPSIDSTPSNVTVTYKAGDVDMDGKVTATDALTALQASVGKVTLTGNAFTIADVDNSTKIEASDALTILQISVGKVTMDDITLNAEA